jgi:hypothetical protein
MIPNTSAIPRINNFFIVSLLQEMSGFSRNQAPFCLFSKTKNIALALLSLFMFFVSKDEAQMAFS